MGSVIDYIECPNCKQEAFSDFYYKTGEDYVNCNNCGYHYSQTLKRDENGKFVTEDGTDNYKFDNLIFEVSELKNPFGSYRLKVYQSPANQCGSFENEDQYNEFKKNIEGLIDNGPKVDSAGFTQEDNFI
jgi:Zn ribbon nucleic-acid-binding protein